MIRDRKAGRTDPDDVPAERPTGIQWGDLFDLVPIAPLLAGKSS